MIQEDFKSTNKTVALFRIKTIAGALKGLTTDRKLMNELELIEGIASYFDEKGGSHDG